jgi:hypothetical protein
MSITGGGDTPQVRASDQEREAVLQRVQQAFAEGRLDDTEFDERMRAALAARTHADLDVLMTDLPAASEAAVARAPVAGPAPGKLAVAYKGSVRRAGRWRVPERYTTVVYKGGGTLDLRVAELAGPVTTMRVVAYKSTVTILVPPGVRAEITGFGIVQGGVDEDPSYRLPADAPVINVRALAYKGTVEVATRPPERPSLPLWQNSAGDVDSTRGSPAGGRADGRPRTPHSPGHARLAPRDPAVEVHRTDR